MRVISGTARGTKLRTLDLEHLRPMLDRVKESLFNIIRDRIEGVRVLDLFSGVGSLGIEALSRGASRCIFLEQDPRLVRVLVQNLENGPHTVEIRTAGDGQVSIDSFYLFRPALE